MKRNKVSLKKIKTFPLTTLNLGRLLNCKFRTNFLHPYSDRIEYHYTQIIDCQLLIEWIFHVPNIIWQLSITSSLTTKPNNSCRRAENPNLYGLTLMTHTLISVTGWTRNPSEVRLGHDKYQYFFLYMGDIVMITYTLFYSYIFMGNDGNLFSQRYWFSNSRWPQERDKQKLCNSVSKYI